MAGSDYTRGSMDIAEQNRTWEGFINFTLWGSGLIMLIVGYATFTVALGMHWIVALVISAVVGVAGGSFMKMGGAWIATVVGLCGIAVVVQLLIMLFGAL